MAKKPRTPRKPTAKAKPADPVPNTSLKVADDSEVPELALIDGSAYIMKPFPGQIVIENKLIKISGDRFRLEFTNGAGIYRALENDDHFTHGELIFSTWSTPPRDD